MKDTPDAPATAKAELEKLGPLSLDEKITAGAFAVTVGLWIFGGSLGINAVAAALLGLSILLITNVVKWKDCLGEGFTARHMFRTACQLSARKVLCIAASTLANAQIVTFGGTAVANMHFVHNICGQWMQQQARGLLQP